MSAMLRAVRYEVLMWTLALVKPIPGRIGCWLRNAALPYRQGRDVRIWDMVHFDTPSNVVLGDRVSINRGCILNAGGGIEIGDDVLIGPNVTIYSQNHRYDANGPIANQGYVLGKITIERHVWVGANVTILPGVTIGAGSIVGAGSVVTRDVEPNTLVVGNPARPVKTLSRAL